MRRRSKVAQEFLDQLMQLPRRSIQDIEKTEEENVRKYTEAATPLIRELSEYGFHVESVGDLIQKQGVEYRNHAEKIVSLLVKWLPLVTYDALREDIIRTLAVPWANPIALKPLLHEFRKTSDFNEKWVLGNSLSVIADDSIFEDLIELVTDKKNGHSREMLIIGLGNLKDEKHKEEAINVLIKLLDDDEVTGHAIVALNKLKAIRAKPYLKKFLNNETTWFRNEAKKTIAKFDKIEKKESYSK